MQRPNDNVPDNEFQSNVPVDPSPSNSENSPRREMPGSAHKRSQRRPHPLHDYEGYEAHLIKLAALDPLEEAPSPNETLDIFDSAESAAAEYVNAENHTDPFRFHEQEDLGFDTSAFYDFGREVHLGSSAVTVGCELLIPDSDISVDDLGREVHLGGSAVTVGCELLVYTYVFAWR